MNQNQKQKQKQRLDKTVAMQTAFSRSEVKNLIKKGEVLINGQAAKSADTQVDWQKDIIAVEGKELCLKEHVYLMLHKPKGVVSATEDARFPTVLSLVPEELWRKGLFPAGRLDKDTTGFVLITDDGDFAHEILSPKKHVMKTYFAKLDGEITPEIIAAFKAGVNINDEYVTLPADLTVAEKSNSGDTGKVMICEGMYHQIKRMFKAFGLTVQELHRGKIGQLPLDSNLKPGEARELTPAELVLIKSK